MPIDQILAELPNLPPGDQQRLLDTLATDQAAKLTSEPILAALPKLTPEDKKKLSHALADEITSEQKLAINEHVAQIVSKWAEWLGKVAAAIGIASIAAVASSLVYVFFILPDKAITQAENSVEKRLGDRVKRIEDAVSDTLVKYGNAQENYKNLTKKSDAISEDLEKRASELDAKFKILEQGPTSKAADVVKAVQTNATGSDLVSDVATLKTDVATLKGAVAAVQDQLKAAIPHPVTVNLSDFRSLVGQTRAEVFVQTGSDSFASVTLVGNSGFPEVKVVYGTPTLRGGQKGIRVSVIFEGPITGTATAFTVAIIQPNAQDFAVASAAAIW